MSDEAERAREQAARLRAQRRDAATSYRAYRLRREIARSEAKARWLEDRPAKDETPPRR